MPRLPPVTSADLPLSGLTGNEFFKVRSLVSVIRVMRNVPLADHCFCATLILPSGVFAGVGRLGLKRSAKHRNFGEDAEEDTADPVRLRLAKSPYTSKVS
jgi:hypothetical protein